MGANRLRATPSALWLTALPGQFKVLSGTSGQSWKTGLRNIMQELLRLRPRPTEANLVCENLKTFEMNPVPLSLSHLVIHDDVNVIRTVSLYCRGQMQSSIYLRSR